MTPRGPRLTPAMRPTGRLAALLLLALLAPAAASAAEVVRFSPQGTVKRVRQVSARFSDPMVPLGDPRAADPFDVTCPEPGAGRWVDSREWVYDFARDLPAGVRCAFRLRPGLTTLAGAALTGRREFAFSTGGPAIIGSFPREGHPAIDEEQAFVLSLDAEPTPDSLLSHVAFRVDGLPEPVGVRVLDGPARAALLRERFGRTPPPAVVVLQARQRFPSSAKVSLVWGRGVATASGVATDQDQVLPFQVRPAFTATFHCERERRDAGCLPITPMTVALSAPVAREVAHAIAVVGPDRRRLAPAAGDADQPFVHQVVFAGPFPEQSTFRVEMPPGLRDDSGRALANAGAFPLTVRTEAFPPLAKFAARFGIVERADPVLPVTVRNLEPALQARLLRVDQKPGSGGFADWVKGKVFRIPPELSEEILPWLRKVKMADRARSVFQSGEPSRELQPVALPKPGGARAFEVVGIPLGAPGLYLVELESLRLGTSLLGAPQPMYVPTAALVTNLSVHLKWGRESSLAWVTALDTGRPVSGARVTVQDCRGTALWRGRTDGQGIARIAALPLQRELPRCPWPDVARPFADWSQTTALVGLDEGLFVVAQTADDVTFVHSTWESGIEPWRFQVPSFDYRGAVAAHTILDRTLLRAGETVSMKHLIRAETLAGFAPVPEARRPARVSIRHLGSNERHEEGLTWDAAGSATTTWRIPKEAKLGVYQVVLVPPARPKDSRSVQPDTEAEEGEPQEWPREWVSGQFRVEEFRVPLMRGAIRAPSAPPVAPDEVTLDLGVQYLAGGGARDLPVTLRTQLRPGGAPASEAFEGFTFANGTVKEGLVRRGRSVEDDDVEEAPDPGARPAIHQRDELRLDAAGTARATITRLPRSTTPLTLAAELEFRDPNGEVQTVATGVTLWPAARLVGVKPDGWVVSRERLKASAGVMDVAGRPVAGVPVRIDLVEQKTYSNRKRLVGGFYAYEHVQETRRLGELCRAVTGTSGTATCEGTSPVAGNVILQATAADEAGRETAAYTSVWVAGSEEWWFEAKDHDRIDLLPERRRYEPGEVARFQVRMPFREATALVAIEREGIQEARVVRLSGKAPVIEVPVLPGYAPNMFVSVLAVRGRVAGLQPTALVDLGRPAFKLGLAEIQVGWRAHELKVQVAAERPVYRVRETAAVRITVKTADGQAPPPGSEVALAAVDEGLLELAPNASWNLLEAMMGRRPYSVRTATAQMQVVGRRHFGLKAVAQGGGGGRAPTRELFDTLLLWKARVPLDARGEARVEVPLNDSLTSFRIVAVATGGVGRFGTGATTIRSTQDLMILPGIAPLVREGDRFRAEVTLRNATDRPLDVELRGRVDGLATTLDPLAVRLGPAEARAVGWELTAPAAPATLRYELEAGERGGPADRIRVSQQVVPLVPVRTYQATLGQWSAPLRQPVERPADALPDRGGVEVAFRATLVDGLAGVREWMRRYPYTCMEQRVSRAVALRDEQLWREVTAAMPFALDEDGLLKYFPTMPWGSEVLTAYVLAVSHAAGWTLPADVLERTQEGLVKFVEGSLRWRGEMPTADLSIRKVAALEALARYGKAEPRLLGSVTLEPNLWPTSAVLDWWSLLERVPGIPNRERRRAEAEQIVRARLTFAGTTMGFATERADALWWLMVSADTNAVRLLLHLVERGYWKPEGSDAPEAAGRRRRDQIDDMGRLVRGVLARQKRGAWDLTVANAWGVLAVEKFSRAFERVPVTGVSAAGLPGATRQLDWTASPKGGALAFPWPAGREDVVVEHAGTGQPWVTIAARAAIPLAAPLAAGYRITKQVTALEPREAGRWSRGDLVRVHLEIEAQTDMTWVVVHDPIPAGASHLGTGLGRDSGLATQGERWQGRAWIAFEERGFEAFRAYFAFVPKGTFTVEYTIRLNQSGRLALPATRVEALYSPDLFGELPNAPIEVAP
jgi:alpha-2-macroglobulin